MAGEAPGPITALWAAVFALSNVYIAAFLATAYLNAHPEKLLAIRNLLRRLRGISVGADDEGGGGASGKPGAASSSAAGAALRNGHCAAPAAGLDTTSTIATDSDGGDEAAPAAPPVELEWRALSLSVPGVSGRRQILQVRRLAHLTPSAGDRLTHLTPPRGVTPPAPAAVVARTLLGYCYAK